MRLIQAMTFAFAAGFTATAFGGSLSMTRGTVNDWNVTPSFPDAGDHTSGSSGDYFYNLENDYAPINYPGGVGYQPSPGGALGETYDLEEMHARINGSGDFQVLVVTSSGPKSGDFYLGDLMLNVNGDQYAVATHDLNRNNVQTGAVYEVLNEANDTDQLQSGSGSYLNNNAVVANDYAADAKVRDIAGPWQVKDDIASGQQLGMATVNTAYQDYGGDEDGTYLIEYTIDPNWIGATGEFSFLTQITWGCGNDVIRLQGATGVDASNPPSVTPSPSAALAGLVLMGLSLTRRKRRA